MPKSSNHTLQSGRTATALRAQARVYNAYIRLTKLQLEQFYAGSVRDVQVREQGGLRIQFPLEHLRQFVGHNGVEGWFEITVSGDNRLTGIRKLN